MNIGLYVDIRMDPCGYAGVKYNLRLMQMSAMLASHAIPLIDLVVTCQETKQYASKKQGEKTDSLSYNMLAYITTWL